MPTILMIGCNHGIQPIHPDPFDCEQALAQRGHFRQMVSELVREHNVQFIAEEWGLEDMTAARAIAGQNEGMRWANVNTSLEELDAMHIPRGYVHDPQYGAEQKDQWNGQREAVMICKLKQQMGNAEEVILICGFEHLAPIAASLEADGSTVEIIDYRIRDWYEADVFAV